MKTSKPMGILAASLLLGAMTALPLTAFAAGATETPAPAQPAARSATSGKTGELSGRQEVIAAQEALNKQDANLKVDGKFGSQTRSALESFQKTHGLKPTGKLDDKTETALNIQ